MNRFILIVMMIFLSASGFGQEVKLEKVSDRFHYQYSKQEPSIQQIQKDNAERQRSWQEEFEAMKAELDEGKRFSDNVKVNVQTDVQQLDDEINLIVTVSYETISLEVAGDDYGLGKYTIQNSNACVFMCNFLKMKLENDLASHIKKGGKIDIKITGATDGTPINSKIPYNGEYGDIKDKPITLNGNPFNMTVTKQTGVTNNGQLAFLRSQGVENYLKAKVEPLKQTQNDFQIFAVENTEKGAGYRRVSVEITIHGAFNNVEPTNTGK